MFGVFAIDKPAGLTSRWTVNRVERLVKPERVGHTGTLDPLATGVLLMAIGSATRLVEFSHLQSKGYEAEFMLGHSSDTLDVEGIVTATPQAAPVTLEQLTAELPNWLGEIAQTPPKFSAVHVGGKRAYELARKGAEFEVAPRTVQINSLELLSLTDERFTLRIDCGTGTYIRTLGSDIAQRLGSDAVMTRLVRTRVGEILLEQCTSLEQLQLLADRACLANALLPPNCLVASLPKVELDSERSIKIRHGIPISLELDLPGPLAAVDDQGELVAILERRDGIYRSLRVFQKTNDTPQPNSSNKPHSPES